MFLFCAMFSRGETNGVENGMSLARGGTWHVSGVRRWRLDGERTKGERFARARAVQLCHKTNS